MHHKIFTTHSGKYTRAHARTHARREMRPRRRRRRTNCYLLGLRRRHRHHHHQQRHRMRGVHTSARRVRSMSPFEWVGWLVVWLVGCLHCHWEIISTTWHTFCIAACVRMLLEKYRAISDAERSDLCERSAESAAYRLDGIVHAHSGVVWLGGNCDWVIIRAN